MKHVRYFVALTIFALAPSFAGAQSYEATLPMGFREVTANLANLLAQGYKVTSTISGAGQLRGVTFVLEKAGSIGICVQPDKDIVKIRPTTTALCGISE
jgi:hypothetical protein